MADQSPILVRTEAGITGYYATYLVTMSTNDTFKARDLLLVQGAVGLKVADWTSVTLTFAGNIVTLATAGLTATPIVVLVGGLK